MQPRQDRDDADRCMPLALRVRTLSQCLETQAGGLLRVLFLRLDALSAGARNRQTFLLRGMSEKNLGFPCCRDEGVHWRELNAKQRAARFIAGVILLAVSAALHWSSGWIVLDVLLAWFGVTHVLAAVTAYPGCPELGAVPSLLLRRSVKVDCVPWRWLDETLHLT